MKCYIQWCGALQWTRWHSYLKQLICSCLAIQFSGKATKVGSPPNFPKLISQLWGIPQPQYFITLLLDPHWTYFWKHYLYYKKVTKVCCQNFDYQIWFCARLCSVKILTQKWRKIFTGPTYYCSYYFFSFMIISDVYSSFIPNKTTLTKYCLTQWIPKLPGIFENHWVRQYLVNFTGLVGKVNITVYNTEPISQVLGMANCPNFEHCVISNTLPCSIWHMYH